MTLAQKTSTKSSFRRIGAANRWKTCTALHPSIQFKGQLCPLCHEIEINAEIAKELVDVSAERDILRASLKHL
jgi:hypothetical protein